ncbi:MAG: Uma2 family endonuclease [Thermoanaerobaculia bacterium]|nr:Uma2 family endonuclease [Thermoanaerobaculia bacterium]
MTAAATEIKKHTISEYLEMEARTGERYNYYDGILEPMPNTTIPYNRIVKNILFALESALFDREDFEVFSAEQKIYLPQYNYYVYPDAVVVSAPPLISDIETNAIINPVLIIEVLSKSTQKHDRGEKFIEYRSLPSFKEYCLINQKKPEALLFFREKPGLWAETEIRGLENEVFLQSIDIRIPLKQIYRRIPFDKAPE